MEISVVSDKVSSSVSDSSVSQTTNLSHSKSVSVALRGKMPNQFDGFLKALNFIA
jgi:hypothetical protein